MIASFSDKKLERFWRNDSRQGIPAEVCAALRRKLNIIAFAEALHDLEVPPANHLEALRGDLRGHYSIRVNDKWRIVFKWENNAAVELRLTDYH